MTKEELRDRLLSEYKDNKIVFAHVDGFNAANIDEFIKQPTDGILYDLNRSEIVVLKFIEDPKWVNDYAMCKVVRKLKERADELESLKNTVHDFMQDIDNYMVELPTIMYDDWNEVNKLVGRD